MTARPVVYRGYVNAWDCDEMGHMNVQFYVAKASEAFNGLLALNGADRAARAKALVTQHRIRFVSEMHVSDLVAIDGGLTRYDADSLNAVLTLRNGFGKPCAEFELSAAHPGLAAPQLCEALPDGPGLKPGDEGAGTLAAAESFRETIRNVVTPIQCDGETGLAPRGVMARFSEAQGHLWAMLGAPRAWQREQNLATATLEYRIRYGVRPQPGTIVRLLTDVVAASSKTIRFRHWLFDAETGDMAATAMGAALFLDRGTRKAVSLPAQVAAAAAGIIARG